MNGVAVVQDEHYKPGLVLRSTLNLPKWIPGHLSWPNLFSTFQPEFNLPTPDDDPPSRTPPKSQSNEEPQEESQKKQRKPSKEPFVPPQLQRAHPPDLIHQLLVNPALYDPLRTPRYPIVLCHGLYGFDSRGPSSFPSMRMHYWSNVLRVLRGKVGAEVIVTSVPGTGSIPSRAARLDEQLRIHARGRGINFLAHSMGGLDCRHLISHIRPSEYIPLSLTTICTPHRGSPFMDWCATNIGIGKLRQQEKELAEELRKSRQRHSKSPDVDFEIHSDPSPSLEPKDAAKAKAKRNEDSGFSFSSISSLPSSFTTLLLSIVDSPAYANLTSHYLNNVFNPATPDDPNVKYWSVAARMSGKSVNVWHPFWLPKMVLDSSEEAEREKLKRNWEEESSRRDENWGEKVPLWADESEWGNDGLVTVQSAKWGEFLGIMEGCDHWEMRGARGIEFGVDLPAIPVIGLGVAPHSTSTSNSRPAVQAQGDGWGFGDWTRFVGAWRKSKEDAAAAQKAEKAGTVHALHKHGVEQAKAHAEAMGNASMFATASTAPSSSAPLSSSGSELPKDETLREKRERERQAADDLIKASTEKLSVVFDWLIDQVPAVPLIAAPSSSSNAQLEKGAEAMSAEKAKEDLDEARAMTDRELGAVAMAHTVGPSSGAASSHPTKSPTSKDSPPSEIRRRMDQEDKGRKKNELATKEDLERFYVALSRKMYDAGL
ncbi:hypothetical protein NLJ89_g1542 [Agrocybe chaxingu]|uniref:Alpha/beta-hydrolase n=1 Tax=Agrocybe chaxingu TaxID=84603 RepID=A0A9W8MZW2_9AGAR|nr:hypothetical protein NLJ89_g1542 [Agrocybe chaxingu]